MKTIVETKKVAPRIPGYTYGASDVGKSPIRVAQLEQLQQSVGFTTRMTATLEWLARR